MFKEKQEIARGSVFNERQKFSKTIFTNFFFLWIFESFVSFHTFIHTWSLKAYIVSVAKMKGNLTGRKNWRL